MLLAFFVPSIQDPRDRFRARRVVERYVGPGRGLIAEKQYGVAERAFTKALESADGKRVDIEEELLRAEAQRICESPEWGGV